MDDNKTFFEYLIAYFNEEHHIDFLDKKVREVYRNCINQINSNENIATANIFASTLFGMSATEFRKNVNIIDRLLNYIDNKEKMKEDNNIVDIFNSNKSNNTDNTTADAPHVDDNNETPVEALVNEYIETKLKTMLGAPGMDNDTVILFKQLLINYTNWISNK